MRMIVEKTSLYPMAADTTVPLPLPVIRLGQIIPRRMRCRPVRQPLGHISHTGFHDPDTGNYRRLAHRANHPHLVEGNLPDLFREPSLSLTRGSESLAKGLHELAHAGGRLLAPGATR